MHTLRQSSGVSRFTTIAALARSVADAPVNAQGQPCVYAGLHRDESGANCLVAKTLDPSLDAQLVLVETDQSLVKSSLEYLVARLKSIGFAVVGNEAQLKPA